MEKSKTHGYNQHIRLAKYALHFNNANKRSVHKSSFIVDCIFICLYVHHAICLDIAATQYFRQESTIF